MGILDDYDPDDRKAFQYGLLQAGLGILANNGRTPYGTAGQAIGAGLQQGLGAGVDYQQNMLTNKLRKQQLDQQSQLQAAQMKRYEAESAKDAAELAQTQNLRTRMGEIATGKSIDPISGAEISRYSPPGAEQAMQNGGQQPVPIGQKPFGISPQEALELYGLGADPGKLADISKMGKPEAFSLSPGQVRFENGQQIAAVPQEQKPLEIERMLDAAGISDPQQRAKYMQQAISKQTTHAPATTVNTYPNPIPVINSKGEEVMARFGNKGDIQEVPYKPRDDSSESERMGAGFYDRMTAAEEIVRDVGGKTPGAERPGLVERAVGSTSVLGNLSQSGERQQYRQAQEDWVRSKLRKESGAVIPNDEMEREISVYFPQIGDQPGVVAQKAKAREVAAASMKRIGGRALKSAPAPTGAVMEEKPSAAQNKGQTIEDENGKRWKSDGMIWKPL